MFTNIGEKIKKFASVICTIEMVIYILGGLILICSGEEMTVTLGLIMIIAGPLLAWICNLVLYGYGELIEKTSEIAKNTATTSRAMGERLKIKVDDKNTTIVEKLKELLVEGAISEAEYNALIAYGESNVSRVEMLQDLRDKGKISNDEYYDILNRIYR